MIIGEEETAACDDDAVGGVQKLPADGPDIAEQCNTDTDVDSSIDLVAETASIAVGSPPGADAGTEHVVETQTQAPPSQTTQAEDHMSQGDEPAVQNQPTATARSSPPQHIPAIRPQSIEVPIAEHQSTRITPPALQQPNRKSKVLEPVLTEVTARVEVAREVDPISTLGGAPPGEESTEMSAEPGIYDEFPASPQSNQLGAMQGHGWSSEFHEAKSTSEHAMAERLTRGESHNDMSNQGQSKPL